MCNFFLRNICLVIILTQVNTFTIQILSKESRKSTSSLDVRKSILRNVNNQTSKNKPPIKRTEESSKLKDGSVLIAINKDPIKHTYTSVPGILLQKLSKTSNGTVLRTSLESNAKPENNTKNNTEKFKSDALANNFKITTLEESKQSVLSTYNIKPSSEVRAFLNISLENITLNAVEAGKVTVKYKAINKPKRHGEPKIGRQNDLPFYLRPRPVIPMNKYHQPVHQDYGESRIDHHREQHDDDEEVAIARDKPTCPEAAQSKLPEHTCPSTSTVSCPTEVHTTKTTHATTSTSCPSMSPTTCPSQATTCQHQTTTENPCGPPVIDLPGDGPCPEWARCIDTQFAGEEGYEEPETTPSARCRQYWRTNFNMPL